MYSSLLNLHRSIYYRQGAEDFKEIITKPKVTIFCALAGSIGFVGSLNILLNWTATTGNADASYHCYKGTFVKCEDTN